MQLADYGNIPQYVEEFDGAALRAHQAQRLRSGPLIRLSGVTREYTLGTTRVHALRGVDLEVGRGEMLAVWGPSGSGKSTLMNILGLVDKPDGGTVLFAGEDVRHKGDDELAQERSAFVGFVFQTFNLLPVLCVLENVMLPLEVQGVPPAQARQRAEELISAVGLGDFMQVRPDRLSGGQRQRTAIARALVTEPALVIADEPTANLDSQNSTQVIDLMHALQQRTGTTFVFSTHDQRLLDRMPRIVELRDGVICEDRRTGGA